MTGGAALLGPCKKETDMRYIIDSELYLYTDTEQLQVFVSNRTESHSGSVCRTN